MDITVIIPVKNEEESVMQLAREVSAALADSQFAWECLWIDDGSTRTSRTVFSLKKSSPHPVRPIAATRPMNESKTTSALELNRQRPS